MKRAAFVFAIAMTAAGVASALGPLPAVPTRLAQPESQPGPGLAANPPRPTLEARQAPVPLLLKPRPAVEPPRVDADAAPPVKAGDGAGEGRVKSAIEADGYKGVKVLRKGANGLWYAEALRGKDRVLLTVDAQGNVAQQ
jgi:hypothetical protein